MSHACFLLITGFKSSQFANVYRKTLMIHKVSVTEILLFSPELIALNYKGIPLENNISFEIKAKKVQINYAVSIFNSIYRLKLSNS